MDTLSQLINLLDNTDKKDFKRFLQRKNRRTDVKNLQLFNLLETDDINALSKLYKQRENNDAYHALRLRLQRSLLSFLSHKAFEINHSEAHEASRLVVVARFLLENGVSKVAFKSLDKAERLAHDIEHFNLVNELLLLKLQYAHLEGAENLDELTARFLANHTAMLRESNLNITYAYLRRELEEVNLKGKIVHLTSLIISSIRKHKISLRDLMTFKSIYQILFIANEYAAIQQDYSLIERYVVRINNFISAQPDKKSTHLFHHISIMYFLANFHLRNKDFSKSESYLLKMAELMAGDKRYGDLFFARQQLLIALNLHFNGSGDAAVSVLQGALAKVKATTKAEDIADLRICLAMFYAQHNNRESLRQLAALTRTDAWYEKKLGMLWTIRKNLMEIIVQAQFENVELALSRLQSFRRRYKKYLQTTSEDRVLAYLRLVEQYLLKPVVAFEPSYQEAVLAQLREAGNSDIFRLSFIAWLIARWEKNTSHEVTLKLIKGAY
ncbi:hypothetical protein [Sphingobacterium paludis]|uniref:Uncharacterized protein n=1 Tax=Sphingobacterium paludis TaxID=1476465 RepID=A0A4R7CV33_9SPHI|nr:hypothetical protein [Sphingobacterium paludis]TDS12313.1 hypothetical protein B0I21_106171 [Sphingobacterium paludis]